MRSWFAGWGAVALLAAYGLSIRAEDHAPPVVHSPYSGTRISHPANPYCPPTPYWPGVPGVPPRAVPPSTTPPGTTPPATIPTEPSQQIPTPQTPTPEAPSGSAEFGDIASATAVPNMFGDLIGVWYYPQYVTGPARVAPQPLRAAFKVSENESARPMNRLFLMYNYYNDVNRTPGLQTGVGNSDFHRETIGFEKTFLDGDASFGLRVPYYQLTGDTGIENSHLDDISLIFKYALINDRCTGNVLSSGLILTLPTGEGVQIQGQSTLNPTVLTPYVGYIYNMNDFFVQGFSSIAVPLDARDVTLLFNSIQLGYRMYHNNNNCNDSCLRGIIPVAELHLNTPLTHRGLDATPVGFSDSLNFTGGCYFNFRRATLGVAAGTPLMGPKPYTVEGFAGLNIWF